MLSGSFLISNAQDLELGVLGGVSYYNGDWNPGIPFNQPEPAFGFLARYSKNTRWAYRANFSMGTLTSNNRFARVTETVPAAFSTKISDISLLVEFNFYDYFTGSRKDYATPYIFAGVSYFGIGESRNQSINNEVETLNKNDIRLKAIGDLDSLPATNGFSIPFGFGFKYSINKKLGLGMEWRMHKTFSDDIEIVQIDTPDKNSNDWFNFTVISLTYKFDLEKRQSCNSIENTRFE